jgi:flavodoxin
MEKVAIIYATKTKHSKKLADEIGTALNVDAQNITVNPDLNDIDFIFIVSGIYGGASMPELVDFLKGMNAPLLKHAAIVTSCASGKQLQVATRQILEEKGIKVIDEFVCKGTFLFVSRNHPNSEDLKAAADFARKVASDFVDKS